MARTVKYEAVSRPQAANRLQFVHLRQEFYLRRCRYQVGKLALFQIAGGLRRTATENK